jgi:hypothetical protein
MERLWLDFCPKRHSEESELLGRVRLTQAPCSAERFLQPCGILSAMNIHHIPWEPLLLGAAKLLKIFGIIPGAVAAFGVRKFYQKRRQNRAMAGWPATDATILNGQAHKEGSRRIWVELTYSYYVGEYHAGKHIHRFLKEDDADEFIRQVKDKRVQIHYNNSDPEQSVILDRDLEMVVLLTPQLL